MLHCCYLARVKTRSFLCVGLALAAFAVGLGVGAYKWRHASAYTQVRAGFVRDALSIAEPVDTLVLGDSISELTWLDGVCGKTFNAAVAGAKIGDVASLAPLAIERTRPKAIVLEVGTNHFWVDPNLSEFKRQYLALVKSLPGRKILVGIPNSPAADSFVRGLAKHIHAAYVEPVTGDLTRAGTAHPTREGATVYRQRIQEACVRGAQPF